MALTTKARKMLFNLAPVEFEKFVDKLKTDERRELVEELEGIAIQATFAAAYVEQRFGNGNGDQGHEDAAKAANKARRQLRCDVIGYNETRDIPF